MKNTMKKRFLQVFSLLLVIAMLAIPVWADASKLPMLTFDKATQEVVHGQARTVQVTVNLPGNCYGITGAWSTSLGSDITLTGGDKVDASTGVVDWSTVDGEPETWFTESITKLTATYTIPADVPAGTYEVTFTLMMYTGDGYDPIEGTAVPFKAKIVVKHATAVHHEATAATCMEKGNIEYWTCPGCSKNFSDEACTTEVADVTIAIDKDAHSYPTTPSGYTDNNNGTHTAYYICEHNAEHKKSDSAVEHDFANGDCVCGAEKPGLKGDVNLDGQINMNDVVALMQHVLMADIITDTTALENGEVTNNTTLDMNDVVKLMQYVLKAIDSLD
jgi:hypothetical protein